MGTQASGTNPSWDSGRNLSRDPLKYIYFVGFPEGILLTFASKPRQTVVRAYVVRTVQISDRHVTAY